MSERLLREIQALPVPRDVSRKARPAFMKIVTEVLNWMWRTPDALPYIPNLTVTFEQEYPGFGFFSLDYEDYPLATVISTTTRLDVSVLDEAAKSQILDNLKKPRHISVPPSTSSPSPSSSSW